MVVEYLFISPGEPAYESYIALRWQMLRRPWGMPLNSAEDSLDEHAVHLLAQLPDHTVVGVGRVHCVDEKVWQVRYMAVLPEFQGRGIGGGILAKLEQYALNAGATQLMLHARESALGFYQNRQYTVVRKSHMLFGEIQHYEMRKQL